MMTQRGRCVLAVRAPRIATRRVRTRTCPTTSRVRRVLRTASCPICPGTPSSFPASSCRTATRIAPVKRRGPFAPQRRGQRGARGGLECCVCVQQGMAFNQQEPQPCADAAFIFVPRAYTPCRRSSVPAWPSRRCRRKLAAERRCTMGYQWAVGSAPRDYALCPLKQTRMDCGHWQGRGDNFKLSCLEKRFAFRSVVMNIAPILKL